MNHSGFYMYRQCNCASIGCPFLFHSTSLHSIPLCTLFNSAWDFIPFHMGLHSIPHWTSFHPTLEFIPLHTRIHSILPHSIALHAIALHSISHHCTSSVTILPVLCLLLLPYHFTAFHCMYLPRSTVQYLLLPPQAQ